MHFAYIFTTICITVPIFIAAILGCIGVTYWQIVVWDSVKPCRLHVPSSGVSPLSGLWLNAELTKEICHDATCILLSCSLHVAAAFAFCAFLFVAYAVASGMLAGNIMAAVFLGHDVTAQHCLYAADRIHNTRIDCSLT